MMRSFLVHVKINYLFTLIFIFISFSSPSFAKEATAKSVKDAPKLQMIQGGNAFPVNFPHKVKVRIALDPGSIAINEKTLKDSMKQITVIACTNGDCQFTAESSLGFYEATFDMPKDFAASQLLPVLAVACSKLGCVKSVLHIHIDKS